MATLALLLILLGLVLILLRAFGIVAPRVHFGWLGLACVVAATALLPGIH